MNSNSDEMASMIFSLFLKIICSIINLFYYFTTDYALKIIKKRKINKYTISFFMEKRPEFIQNKLKRW